MVKGGEGLLLPPPLPLLPLPSLPPHRRDGAWAVGFDVAASSVRDPPPRPSERLERLAGAAASGGAAVSAGATPGADHPDRWGRGGGAAGGVVRASPPFPGELPNTPSCGVLLPGPLPAIGAATSQVTLPTVRGERVRSRWCYPLDPLAPFLILWPCLFCTQQHG